MPNYSNRRILKYVLSYLQRRDGVPYQKSLEIIAKVIQTGDALNNPLFAQLLETDLPGDPGQLHDLLRPGGDR